MLDISHLRIHALEQKRDERTSNGKGGFALVPNSMGLVYGRVVPATTRDVLIAQRQEARVTHAIYLEPNSDVKVNDIFVFEGRPMRVVIPNITPSVPIYQKVLAEEVQRATESSS